MTIDPSRAYLDRTGHRVTITRDRGAGQVWRWVTSRGYYVKEDGSACMGHGAVREDLTTEVM